MERSRACVSDVLFQLVSITVQNSTKMVYRKWGIKKIWFFFLFVFLYYLRLRNMKIRLSLRCCLKTPSKNLLLARSFFLSVAQAKCVMSCFVTNPPISNKTP